MKFISLAALATLALSMPAIAQAQSSAFEDHVIEQLACLRRPTPTPTITHLVRSKLIDLKSQQGYDSISCWKLSKPLRLKGLSITAVCAYEDDDLIKQQHPGYYWRGPGTSPGVQLTLITPASPNAARQWWAKAGDLYSKSPKFEASAFYDGLTEISCNEWQVR
jgi:hypothetical protein